LKTHPCFLVALSAVAAACGAKTELDAPTTASSPPIPIPEPPGCQWRVGRPSAIGTDVSEAHAPRVGHTSEGAVGDDGVRWLWRSFESLPGSARSLSWRVAHIGFDGAQRGPTRLVAERGVAIGAISIIDGPEIVRTSAGYAALLWQSSLGCKTVRLSNEGDLVDESPQFAASNFCEDLAALADGALRVYVGGRPVGSPRLPFIRVMPFVDIDANNVVSAPRDPRSRIIARATFSDRTGVELGPSDDGDALIATATDRDGARTATRSTLQAWPRDATVDFVRMRADRDRAIAHWVIDARSGPSAAEYAEFSRGGALVARRSLAFGTLSPHRPLWVSIDASATRLFLLWTESASSRERQLFARVFDRAGNALSPPLLALATADDHRAFVRATPRGALLYGAGAAANLRPAFAAPIECVP
jgi:hypothetical protein